MSKLVSTLLVLAVMVPSITQAAPTPAQLCESAVELASAKYAQCRLTAESKHSKTGDAGKRTAALGKCSERLSDAFSKASLRYGASCAATEPSSAFDEYLKQCSDDAAAGAAGAALPDYVGDLASCNADLGTCNGDLGTCTADLATTTADLATCEDDRAACEALPPARLLKTGETTSYGAGSDGDLQIGVARSYIDNGDGTITDPQTGLMWEKKSDDDTIHDKDNVYTWSGPSFGSTNVMDGTVATTFLAALNGGGGFAGHTDWRLPNLVELESIRDLQNENPAVSAVFNTNCGAHSDGNPGCTVTTCSCIFRPEGYWSSSTLNATTIGSLGQLAWTVGFEHGGMAAGYKYLLYYARAVRGGA